MSETRPTLDQQRALHAWRAVENARERDDAAEYKREARRLPVRIRTSGLGQALAFLGAKANAGKGDGDASSVLLVDLDSWLLKERKLGVSVQAVGGPQTLIEHIINGDSRLLRRATEEALSYLQWLTRFAEAGIESDD